MLGIEPVGGKAGPVEIQAGKTPQDHAVSGCYETPKDNSYESGDECAILLG